MLHKDQYNQDEYNDYYRQETEGAEVGSSAPKEKSTLSKMIPLLILLALIIAGYFGYTSINSSPIEEKKSETSQKNNLPPTTQHEVKQEELKEDEVKEEIKKEPSKSEEVSKADTQNSTVPTPTEEATATITEEVSKAVSNQEEMTPEDIATIVEAVMKQIKQQPNAKETITKKDDHLMDELSSSKVDSVANSLMKELESLDVDENKDIDNSNKEKIDVYNKVNVQNSSGTDDLSQLSNQIKNLIDEEITIKDSATYTNSLDKEVDVRQNEMRIMVVRAGDTLGKLAKRAYGDARESKRIYEANPEITRPDRIYIGQKLRIPN